MLIKGLRLRAQILLRVRATWLACMCDVGQASDMSNGARDDKGSVLIRLESRLYYVKLIIQIQIESASTRLDSTILNYTRLF